ncbi:N-acetylmuramoyl-L-alanine amidase [Prosthecobacter sp.]|uniref:N-acetylmuramoyl-L-alanine amidase n=1 Tax=Prosthecobacter sp. TaxID=1965333 RepID=UPI003784F367
MACYQHGAGGLFAAFMGMVMGWCAGGGLMGQQVAEPARGACEVAGAAGAAAAAEKGWRVLKIDGRDYVDAGGVRDFYRFESLSLQDGEVWLRSPKMIVKAKVGAREMRINNVLFMLSEKVEGAEGGAWFSRLDLCKLIDPVLRPSYIMGAEGFDTVVIDPSGGGHATGAKGVYGFEKDYTLKLGEALKAALVKRGLKVVMTRGSDVFLSVEGRVALANEIPGSIYIGLQFRAGEAEECGVETEALSPQGTISKEAFTGNARDAENIALATAVHASVISRFKLVDRGVVRSTREELAGLKAPGVVFAGGFVTNAKECERIASEAGRQEMAGALGDAILNYRRAVGAGARSGKGGGAPAPGAAAPAAATTTTTSSPAVPGTPGTPAKALPRVAEASVPRSGVVVRYPWKVDIRTTVFWIGEPGGGGGAGRHSSSSWDALWEEHYGGVDDPKSRNDQFCPAGFVPKLNPFYVALPYNDVLNETAHKPEAAKVIPWFGKSEARPGRTVLKDRWIAVRSGNRVCYAQWGDCGPGGTDDHEYVFGSAGPRGAGDGGAGAGVGLEISPGVRDYLGLSESGGKCDWRFVDRTEVPDGPWRKLGANNEFAQGGAGEADAAAVSRLEELRRKREAYFKTKDGAEGGEGAGKGKSMSADGGKEEAAGKEKEKASALEEVYPTAEAVAGRPGFVYSPHARDQGMIDVRDMKRGQKVKCPFTQKVFLVP